MMLTGLNRFDVSTLEILFRKLTLLSAVILDFRNGCFSIRHGLLYLQHCWGPGAICPRYPYGYEGHFCGRCNNGFATEGLTKGLTGQGFNSRLL